MAMRSDFIQNFRNEAKIIAQFNHENIINVYDFEECFQTLFIIMEHLEGMSLRSLLKRMLKLPPMRIADYLLQTSAGLLYDVLCQYDPEHVLLRQAKDDVLRDEFDVERLSETLCVLEKQPIRVKQIAQPSPLALPLVIDRLSSRLSTETIATRLERFTRSFDAAS